MARRTIAQARALFEQARPQLNDYWVQRYQSVLDQKESRAKQHADQFLAGREQEALGIRDAALRALTESRDGFEDLAREGKEGRISATDYSKRLIELKAQQAAAEEQLTKAEEIAVHVERVEEDPVAWFSDQQERIPRLQMEFPW